MTTCKDCRQEKPHHGRGLCKACHERRRYWSNPEREGYRKWLAYQKSPEMECERKRREYWHKRYPDLPAWLVIGFHGVPLFIPEEERN